MQLWKSRRQGQIEEDLGYNVVAPFNDTFANRPERRWWRFVSCQTSTTLRRHFRLAVWQSLIRMVLIDPQTFAVDDDLLPFVSHP